MLKYLKQVFGNDLSMEPYELNHYPGYISYNYSGNIISWDRKKCVVITPETENIHLQALKKQFAKVQEKCDYPCAIALNDLTASQRKNLIENRIPFVAAPNQVYFPFWGSVFSERYNTRYESPEKMTATTQLVFLYLFYRLSSDTDRFSQAELTQEISIPKSSCSRAIHDLKDYGLISEVTEGRNKWISLADDRNTVINAAMKYMRSPIARRIYLREYSEIPSHKLGGIRALSSQTMLADNDMDGSLVFSRKQASEISDAMLMTERDFLDLGGIAAEVWKYDPALLSESELVDDISLILCLHDDPDERVQSALDGIRNRYGIEGSEEK